MRYLVLFVVRAPGLKGYRPVGPATDLRSSVGPATEIWSPVGPAAGIRSYGILALSARLLLGKVLADSVGYGLGGPGTVVGAGQELFLGGVADEGQFHQGRGHLGIAQDREVFLFDSAIGALQLSYEILLQ